MAVKPRGGSRNRAFTVGAVQMCSTEDVDRNLAQAERWVLEAVGRGADLVALPENFAYLRVEGERPRFRVRLDDAFVRGLGGLARRAGCYLLAGSVPEAVPGSTSKIYNTSLLFTPGGRLSAIYRKIHRFDVDIPGGPRFRESRWVEAGREPVVARTRLGRLGLSICYDLRFPELYRRLVLDGAEVLLVPSAFTAYTGRAHWMTLLRARAVENQCFVVAPAQVGRHGPGRASYGHTAVVDPWGEVLAQRPRAAGVVLARVDLGRLAEVRRNLPALRHIRTDRFFPTR